jgi:hypothetical protein
VCVGGGVPKQKKKERKRNFEVRMFDDSEIERENNTIMEIAYFLRRLGENYSVGARGGLRTA